MISIDTDIDYTSLSDADLIAAVVGLSTARQALDVALGAALIELDTRGVHKDHGYANAADMAANTSPITVGDARGLARLQADIQAWPVIAAAWAAKGLRTPNAKLVVRFLRRFWGRVPEHGRDVVLQALLFAAAASSTRKLAEDITALTEHLTTPEDGVEDGDNDELDSLHMQRTPTGRGVGNFDLHQEAAELLWAAINALNTPRPEPDGSPDARSVEKRNADGLTELLRRCCDGGRLPEDGGERPHVHLNMDLEDLPNTNSDTNSDGVGGDGDDYDLFHRYAEWVADLNAERDNDTDDDTDSDAVDVDGDGGESDGDGEDPTLDLDLADIDSTESTRTGRSTQTGGGAVPGCETGGSVGGFVDLDAPSASTDAAGAGRTRTSPDTDTPTTTGTDADSDCGGAGVEAGLSGAGCCDNHHHDTPDTPDEPDGPGGSGGSGWSRAADRRYARQGLSPAQRRAALEAAMVAALLRRRRRPTLRWTGAVSRAMARRVACSADWTLVVTKNGRPVDLGRRNRFAGRSMREHLTLRDRGCAFPNCGRPPSWCDAHHIVSVEDGGETTTVNLLLLCRIHHRLVHRTQWRIIMGRNETPLFIPPESIDPQQRPLPGYGRRMPHTT